MTVEALVNDTTGLLAAARYDHQQEANIAVIVGTGATAFNHLWHPLVELCQGLWQVRDTNVGALFAGSNACYIEQLSRIEVRCMAS